MNRSFAKFQNENICKLRNLKNAKSWECWKIINSLDNKNRETAPLKDLFLSQIGDAESGADI